MASSMVPFKYGDFYDVPRLLMFRYKDRLFLLGSYFDEEKDDYEENYMIELLAPSAQQDIADPSWQHLATHAGTEILGEIPVKSVVFDETKRRTLDPTFLDKFLEEKLRTYKLIAENPEHDESLTPEDEVIVANLAPDTVKRIDDALLGKASPTFLKVAYIVGSVMRSLPDRPEGVPDVYYAQRVAKLVEAGLLEARGNLRRMRFSEVRLTPRASELKQFS